MPRTVYICGNDGSGKSTFLKRYAARLNSTNVPFISRHYYESTLRTIIRGCIDRILNIARKKNPKKSSSTDNSSDGRVNRNKRFLRFSVKHLAVAVFLWIYQTMMGLESRSRDLVTRNKVILSDRCFVDDLASIYELLGLPVSVALVKWSAKIFPIRAVHYLTAGSDQEYARIVEVDLSPETHLRKHNYYVQLIQILESSGAKVYRHDTRGPTTNISVEIGDARST